MAKSKVKPRVFLGSSTEGHHLAQAIQVGLLHDADVEMWSQGMFRLGDVPLEALLRAPDGFDFAVFLFSPDDVTKMRGDVHLAVRDNVLFELGLFIGRLGRDRSFFVTPVGEDELRLPSDLKGITAAQYDAKQATDKPSVAVAHACYDIIEAIRALGPLHRSSSVLYELSQGTMPLLRGKESRFYKSNKPTSEKAKGQFTIDRESVIRVDRTNIDGKYEIELRPQGPKRPSFSKRHNPPPRLLHVSCEARVEAGAHTLRFLLKDEEADEWLTNEKRIVSSQDWMKIDVYLWVDSTVDCLFRIDDQDLTLAPSTVFIRNLLVVEESS
jgi:hypothetical protein